MRLLAFFLPLLLLMMPAPARADLVMHNKTNTAKMRLQDSTCSHAETMAILKPEWRPKFKNMRIVSNDDVVRYFGCWHLDEEGMIVVLLSDGSTMRFPASSFQEAGI